MFNYNNSVNHIFNMFAFPEEQIKKYWLPDMSDQNEMQFKNRKVTVMFFYSWIAPFMNQTNFLKQNNSFMPILQKIFVERETMDIDNFLLFKLHVNELIYDSDVFNEASQSQMSKVCL